MAETGFLSEAIFFAAHPDDGELLAGGLMAAMAAAGKRVILADATRGETGTRGTPEIRAEEAAEGARILGVERVNLGLKDGGLRHNMEAVEREIVTTIRTYRPRLIFTHTGTDHHPDHNALHTAVRRAFFLSNVLKYDTGQERHAVRRLMYFWSMRHDIPDEVDFIADITPVWEKKLGAIRAHRSQVAGGMEGGPETYLTGDLFWHRIQARFAYFGGIVGVHYGEPYKVEGILRVDNPLELPDVR